MELVSLDAETETPMLSLSAMKRNRKMQPSAKQEESRHQKTQPCWATWFQVFNLQNCEKQWMWLIPLMKYHSISGIGYSAQDEQDNEAVWLSIDLCFDPAFLIFLSEYVPSYATANMEDVWFSWDYHAKESTSREPINTEPCLRCAPPLWASRCSSLFLPKTQTHG